MHILIIINKPRRDVAFNLFRMSIISLSVIFCKKGNIFFAVSTFGSLGPGSAVGEKGKKKNRVKY